MKEVWSRCSYSNIYMRAAKSLQLCSTRFDPMDHSLPGSLLSMEFSRQEYWSGQPFPSPGDLLHPGIKTGSAELQADSFFFLIYFLLKDNWFTEFCCFGGHMLTPG